MTRAARLIEIRDQPRARARRNRNPPSRASLQHRHYIFARSRQTARIIGRGIFRVSSCAQAGQGRGVRGKRVSRVCLAATNDSRGGVRYASGTAPANTKPPAVRLTASGPQCSRALVRRRAEINPKHQATPRPLASCAKILPDGPAKAPPPEREIAGRPSVCPRSGRSLGNLKLSRHNGRRACARSTSALRLPRRHLIRPQPGILRDWQVYVTIRPCAWRDRAGLPTIGSASNTPPRHQQ